MENAANDVEIVSGVRRLYLMSYEITEVVDMCYDVIVNWDEDAGVWCAVCDGIPIALESHSFDALIARVKIAAYEILELNGKAVENTQLCFITAHKERVA